MRYSDTPSKTSIVIHTLIACGVALLIAYGNQDIFDWKMFLLAGLACYVVALWTSYSWERTWSQEWNNLDKQLEEMHHKLDNLEEWTSYSWERTSIQEWNSFDKQLEEMHHKLDKFEEIRHKFDTLDIDDLIADSKLTEAHHEYISFKEKYGENVEDVWFEPLQCTQGLLSLSVTTELFLKTRAKLKDLHIVGALLDDMVAQMETDGLTLNDFDKARVNFHKHLYLQMRQGRMTPIGCAVLNSIFYRTLTEDFYDLLETEVELHPEDFPENFLTSVKLAKTEFRQTYSEE